MFIARIGSRILQGVQPSDRANAINTMADLLLAKQDEITEANKADVAEATKQGLAKPLLSRLSLTPNKLKSLASGKCRTESRIGGTLKVFEHKRCNGMPFTQLLCKYRRRRPFRGRFSRQRPGVQHMTVRKTLT